MSLTRLIRVLRALQTKSGASRAQHWSLGVSDFVGSAQSRGRFGPLGMLGQRPTRAGLGPTD
eukprot:7113725-Alexandrium_andersonii.AAC.1